MTSVNEARSAEDLFRAVNDLNPRPVQHQLIRAGGVQVRSNPDTTERQRVIALGLDTTFPFLIRPNFVSSENVSRVQHLLLSDAHYIQHGTIRPLPELIQRPQRDQQSQQSAAVRNPVPVLRPEQPSTMAGTGSSDQSRSASFRHPNPEIRDALLDSNNIAKTMADLEKRRNQQSEDEESADIKSYDSSVDDPNTYPALPAISRRQSEQLDRRAGSNLLGKWSLPDLRRIETTFTNISSMEGITDPDIILRILQRHPEIDYLYMSPTMKPTNARYSPYLMHLACPGRIDILNCCVVTRKNVMRYINGKEPRCLSLKRWSFEQRVMFKLRNISFIKNFKQIKAFTALGLHLDMSLFGKTRRKIRSQLLACNPSYAETLLLVRTMCLDMASMSLIHVDAELTYTLREFLEEQDQYSQEIVTKLERYQAILLHLISRMCWDDVITAGLAEESRGRRGGAPKRVNEFRKMQRLRQSSPSPGMRHNADDVNIGMWIKSNDFLESREMEVRKKERCNRLFRLIYLMDCLIRDALYQVFISSLKTSANFLSMHLVTFPSDDEISALVKGYVGDLDQADMFTYNDSSDDGGDGKGPSARRKPETDENRKDQHENKQADKKIDRRISHEQTAYEVSHAAHEQGRPEEPSSLGRSRASTEMDASTTLTTLRMSSSAERFGMETDTTSTMDNALYSPAFGETDITDSLHTSSSTLSDENRNINPMGAASELYTHHGAGNDDLAVPLIIGSEMRILRLFDVQTQNQYTSSVEQQGTSAEQEMDVDDVTVIELFSDIQQAQPVLADTALSTAKKPGNLNRLKGSDSDETEDDLTITSDENSIILNTSTNTQSNNFSFQTPTISENIHLSKIGNKGRAVKIGGNLDRTSSGTFSSVPCGILSSANLQRLVSKKNVTRKPLNNLDKTLSILQEQGEMLDSDSSESVCTVPNDKNVVSEKEEVHLTSFYSVSMVHKNSTTSADEKASSDDEVIRKLIKSQSVNSKIDVEEIGIRIGKNDFISSLSLSRLPDKRHTTIPAYTDMYSTDITCCRSASQSFSEEYPVANAEMVAEKSLCTSAMALSSTADKPLNDSRLSGILGGLFSQNNDSSVDFISKSESERIVASSFPILEKAIWVSGYIGKYMNLRQSRSSSVDENGIIEVPVPLKHVIVMNELAKSGSSKDILDKPRLLEHVLKKEADDSEDETTASFDSARNFGDYSESEPIETPTLGGNKNTSHNEPKDEENPDVKKIDENKTTEKVRNQADNGLTSARDDQTLITQTNDIDTFVSLLDIVNSHINAPDNMNDENECDEKKDAFYVNANTSPNVDDDDSLKNNAALNKDSFNYLSTGNIFSKLGTLIDSDPDVPENVFTNESLSGIRKDGGKRKKSSQYNENRKLSIVITNEDEKENINDDILKANHQRAKSLDNSMSSNKLISVQTSKSHTTPTSLSEESSSARNLQQLTTVSPNSIQLMFKVPMSKSNGQLLETLRVSSSHGHEVHFTSINSSFAKTDSDRSFIDEEADSVIEGRGHSQTVLDILEEELLVGGESKMTDNDTENDLTDSVLESTYDANIGFTGSGNIYENEVKSARQTNPVDTGRPAGKWSPDKYYLQKIHITDVNENQEEKYNEEAGKGAGYSGGGGGGGGGGGSSGYAPFAKKRLVPDLKPMFHASLNIVKELVCMTPDVYDFTAASFNIVHQMEVRVISIESLTSNPAFLTFAQPSTDGHTSVDKRPRGPNLERVLRIDPAVINLKNSVYSSIDVMFHSVTVYTKEMQSLYLKYFQDKRTDFDIGVRDVDFYCNQLQRSDARLKIVERLPESQRLGMFLIDLAPYKEFVRQCSMASLQQLQLELNADVVRMTRFVIEKLNDLHTILESHPTTLVPLFQYLNTMDSINQILKNMEFTDISHIGALYNVIDRFDVPHTHVDRRAFESTHYLITSARHTGEVCRKNREEVVDDVEKCLARDVRYIHIQVRKVVKPLVESEHLLDGHSDPLEIRKCLIETEEVVRTHVAMANFVREVQRYLGLTDTKFTELFNLSARYVNTRNLWLLMADWDAKLHKWKTQSFLTLDIQEINSYTFRYMEACDKLEKLLPKNTVIPVFEEKMDVMLRWLNFIIEFRGQAVKQRHWSQIEEVLGVEFGDQLPLTLASLMSINAIEKQKMLHVILNKARAESNVQHEFDEVAHQCRSLSLPVQLRQKSLVDGGEMMTVYLLGDTFEIEESLNYFVMEMERIELSPHAGFLHNILEEFVQSILEALEKLVQWMEMQMKLSRLRRLIVRHPEVSETLPSDVARYKQIYMMYSRFMEDVMPQPNVMRWCADPALNSLIEGQHDEIIRIYRTIKRDIELRGGQENTQQEAQRQFGTWVVM